MNGSMRTRDRIWVTLAILLIIAGLLGFVFIAVPMSLS